MKNIINSLLEGIAVFLFKNNIKGRGRYCDFFNLHDILISNNFGVQMKLDPNQYIEREIIANGYYEDEVLQKIKSSLEETSQQDNIFWDIGANVGLHSLTLEKLYPRLKVYAFEPYYYNFNKLMENSALNRSSIKLFNFGLSNQHEINCIYTTKGNAGRTGFLNMDASQNTAVNILNCSGDFLVDQNISKSPTIIKLDVEGWEMNVLQGCEDILNDKRLHTIIFEGDKNIENVELIPFLKKYGFNVVHLERNNHIVESNENYIATR